jgi:hypothetical protein
MIAVHIFFVCLFAALALAPLFDIDIEAVL